MHRTIFWGGGDTSGIIYSIKYVSIDYIQAIIEVTYNKNTDLLQAHYYAQVWRITHISQAYLARVFQLT